MWLTVSSERRKESRPVGETEQIAAQGSRRKTSEEGKGVWKKKPMRAGGLMRRESEEGTSISW